MPRNTTGGSGHKAQKNAEGGKARNNRVMGDLLLDDILNGEKTEGVYIGRILKRLGSGRMEVFYINHDHPLTRSVQQIIPMRGGLRGKGKKSVWVDIDSLVMIADTGLAGTTHEIVSVFTEEQVRRYRKMVPDADPRLFMKSSVDVSESKEEGFEFSEDAEGEIDVDGI
jgi:hypothetical protein